MSHSIRNKRSLHHEIRKLAGKSIHSIIRSLKGIPDNPGEAIHDVRKRVKKLRALLRLVGDGPGNSFCKRETRTLRDASRILAEFRDSTVRMELVAALRRNHEHRPCMEVLRMADKRVTALHRKTHSEGTLEEAAQKALKILKGLKKRIRKWRLEDKGDEFQLLKEGLRDSYGAAREQFARCLIHPTAENFHEWRKACKYLRHQLGFLKKVSPGTIEPLLVALHELSGKLGQDHDQVLLAEILEPLAARNVSLEGLVALHADLERNHRTLMDGCLSAGGTIFAASAEEFVESIIATWSQVGVASE